jgi:hydroxyacid-oxoacid transhydrogenase
MRASQHTACPCHGCRTGATQHAGMQAVNQLRKFATPVEHIEKEYAFEVCSYLIFKHVVIIDAC